MKGISILWNIDSSVTNRDTKYQWLRQKRYLSMTDGRPASGAVVVTAVLPEVTWGWCGFLLVLVTSLCLGSPGPWDG